MSRWFLLVILEMLWGVCVKKKKKNKNMTGVCAWRECMILQGSAWVVNDECPSQPQWHRSVISSAVTRVKITSKFRAHIKLRCSVDVYIEWCITGWSHRGNKCKSQPKHMDELGILGGIFSATCIVWVAWKGVSLRWFPKILIFLFSLHGWLATKVNTYHLIKTIRNLIIWMDGDTSWGNFNVNPIKSIQPNGS